MVTLFLRNLYKSFAIHVLDVPPRLLSLLFFLLLLSLPVVRPTFVVLDRLIFANIMAIFAASWDLLVGRTGQMSLGHALFFGLGAYGTAILHDFYSLPLLVTIPLSIAITVLVALVLGIPSLRVKGPYLALVTMAFPLIATGIVFFFKEWTGGESGIWGLPTFFPSLSPKYERFVANYYLTLLTLFISGVILYKIANSKIGIVFVSILDDELASKASGINVTKYKLMAFAISALFASLAGCVYAHVMTGVGRSTLSLTRSFLPVVMTMFAGLGTIYGPIAGSYFFYSLDRYVLGRFMLDVPNEWHMFIFIVIVVILIIKWPRGMARFVTDKLDDLSEEREIEERGPHIWKKYKKKKKSTPEG